MKDQPHRASLSIPLNLTEGSSRPSTKDRKRFYTIAFGSLREVQCLLKLLKMEDSLQLSDKLGAHLYRLYRSL